MCERLPTGQKKKSACVCSYCRLKSIGFEQVSVTCDMAEIRHFNDEAGKRRVCAIPAKEFKRKGLQLEQSRAARTDGLLKTKRGK